jgi:signal transduction histidine kinase
MLSGFAPFIAFFIATRLASPLAGLAAACAVSLIMCLRIPARGSKGWWRRGESLKVLEVGSLALFAVLLLYTALFAPRWTVATVRLAVDAGLFAIVAISLAIGRPFTLQYARERVPREYWNTPRFLAVNQHITLAWAVALAIMVAADASAEYVSAIPLWVDIAATVLAFAGAVIFTVRYPAAVRRAAQAAVAGKRAGAEGKTVA